MAARKSALTVRPWGVGYAVWQGDKRVTGQNGNPAIAGQTADLRTIKNRATAGAATFCHILCHKSGCALKITFLA